MVAKVKVLVKGYINLINENKGKGWSTIVLIDNGKDKVIVDPGTVKNQDIILKALKKEGLNVGDITHVLITHSHLDHYRNLGMFPNAIAIDLWGYWIKDKAKLVEWPNSYSKGNDNVLRDIQAVKTPGHDESCLTFFVNGKTSFKNKTVEGIIAICGDIFWKKDFPRIDEEPFAENKETLKKSRELVMKNSSY